MAADLVNTHLVFACRLHSGDEVALREAALLERCSSDKARTTVQRLGACITLAALAAQDAA